MKKLNDVIKEVDKYYTNCYIGTAVSVPGISNFVDLDKKEYAVHDIVTSGCDTFIMVSAGSYYEMIATALKLMVERSDKNENT